MATALAKRFAGALLAGAVSLGAPLHCLAEGLFNPAPSAAAISRDLRVDPPAPGIQCASHCSSPQALVPFTGLEGALNRRVSRDQAPREAPRAVYDLILQVRLVARAIGPPVTSVVASQQNLPLLI